MSDGTSLYYEDNRRANRPVVVFLHGWTASMKWWNEQVIPLAKEYYRVVTIDLRGQGKSDKPIGGYSVEGHAEDVNALLDYMGIKSAAFFGHSMGGGVAQILYKNHPEKVNAIGIVASGACWIDNILRKIGMNLLMYVSPVIKYRPSLFKLVVKVAARGAFSPHTSWKFIRKWTDDIAELPPYAVINEAKEAIMKFDNRNSVHEIKVPTVIIDGKDDLFTPNRQSKFLHDQIEGSELHIIKKAGHCVMVEQPDAFNQILVDFLKRTYPPDMILQ